MNRRIYFKLCCLIAFFDLDIGILTLFITIVWQSLVRVRKGAPRPMQSTFGLHSTEIKFRHFARFATQSIHRVLIKLTKSPLSNRNDHNSMNDKTMRIIRKTKDWDEWQC